MNLYLLLLCALSILQTQQQQQYKTTLYHAQLNSCKFVINIQFKSFLTFSLSMEPIISRNTDIDRIYAIETTRESLDSTRRGGISHLSRILLLFSFLLVLSIVFIIVLEKRKESRHNVIPSIKNDLFTPPTLLS